MRVTKQKENGVLGDFVPNNKPNAGGVATAPRPIRPPEGGGYGASSFGEAVRPVKPQAQPAYRPQPSQQTRPQPQPTQLRPQPVAAQPAARPMVADAQPAPALRPVAAITPVKTKKMTKIPLILTVVGIIVFIGGVAGLFMYALGGK